MATMTLENLVDQLRKAYGDALRAVVLYGSSVAGEHIKEKSDYNVLVVAAQLPLERLQAASAVARAWKEAGNPPPMTFTEAEWRSSADVFPMEYADILERHRVLYGTALFDGISVAPADLRLQVEHQALGMLLRLRQGVLLAGDDAKQQSELLSGSLSSIMVLFRAIARLHGEQPPQNYEALSRQVAALTGIDAEPFVAVVQHQRGEQALPKSDTARVLMGYLQGLEGITAYIDRYTSTNQST